MRQVHLSTSSTHASASRPRSSNTQDPNLTLDDGLSISSQTRVSGRWCGQPFSGLRYHVKNANPSTPLVYPNQRFRKITTPDANTYCGCDSAVTYFSAMSNKGTCSTPTPKCTSDSFFSLQTPHTTEQVNKNQGRHTATAHKQRKEARCSSVATVSSALGDTAVQFSSEHLTPLP